MSYLAIYSMGSGCIFFSHSADSSSTVDVSNIKEQQFSRTLLICLWILLMNHCVYVGTQCCTMYGTLFYKLILSFHLMGKYVTGKINNLTISNAMLHIHNRWTQSMPNAKVYCFILNLFFSLHNTLCIWKPHVFKIQRRLECEQRDWCGQFCF